MKHAVSMFMLEIVYNISKIEVNQANGIMYQGKRIPLTKLHVVSAPKSC